MHRKRVAVRSFCCLVCIALFLTPRAMTQNASSEVRHITLTEAKSKAAGAATSNVGQLAMDAAKYHRRAAQADYFPKLSAEFVNLQYDSYMGETIGLVSRRKGQTLSGREAPLFGKDWTAVA